MLNTENYNGQKIGKVNSSILPNFYSCRNRGNDYNEKEQTMIREEVQT